MDRSTWPSARTARRLAIAHDTSAPDGSGLGNVVALLDTRSRRVVARL